MLILIPERRITDQENVQDDSARPNVDGFAVGLLLQHLWREITGRAGESEPRQLFQLHFDGQAKVRELHSCSFSLAGQQEILGLQVPVHDSVCVAMVDTLQDLLYAVRGIGLWIKLTRHDILEQFTASHSGELEGIIIRLSTRRVFVGGNLQIKDQIVEVLLLYTVMQAHDVWVLKLSANPGLSLQLLKVWNGTGLVSTYKRTGQWHARILPRDVNFFVLIIFAANSRPVDFWTHRFTMEKAPLWKRIFNWIDSSWLCGTGWWWGEFSLGWMLRLRMSGNGMECRDGIRYKDVARTMNQDRVRCTSEVREGF